MITRGDALITLFAEEKSLLSGISSVAISGIFHGLALGALSYGLLRVPRIQEPILTERYSVRHLDLHSPELRDEAGPEGTGLYPQSKPTTLDSDSAHAGKPSPSVPAVPKGAAGKQTLVQPEFHTHQVLPEKTPVPTVVIWTPELASTKQIVPPRPDAPSDTEAQASLDPPNEELNQEELAASPGDDQPKIQTPPAGSTSPLVVHAESLVQAPPATVSESAEEPTPTAVLSISDVQMADGTVILPPVNETDSTPPKIDPAPAPVPAIAAKAKSESKPNVQPSASSETESSLPTSAGGGDENGTTDHIQLPRDGQFRVIVVGTSLTEQYPETQQIWSDRVAYTVFLHVGLTKNWILQYAQSRAAEASASGTVARVEAPWPYDILRPNLVSRDLNADALMVHGILNESGRLESLAVAFPPQFSHAAFVLRALQKWQFRPARQLGKPTAVEVLLIIPDELD